VRVIEVKRFGDPDVLVPSEAPDPTPGPGQVVVDVTFADTLFVETQIRNGAGGDWFKIKPPYVPGGGVAGTVRDVGSGVDPGWIGRQVITRTADNGGYAERAVAQADALVPVPEQLSLPDAAALIHDGLTAMILFTAARLQPGERVLITAAAGGMGVLLVQLAHAAGATVVAAARGKQKLDLVKELGADVVVDYSEPGWPQQVRATTGDQGLDVVLDGAGGQVGLDAFELTRPGGRFSAHGAPSGGFARIDPAEAERRGITLRGIRDIHAALATDEKRMLERAVAEAAAGRLRPVIGRTYPLDQAADAHTAIEARAVTGKTLLMV
jgi:NADPH:quinone reductase